MWVTKCCNETGGKQAIREADARKFVYLEMPSS